jgi:hypothetical protein
LEDRAAAQVAAAAEAWQIELNRQLSTMQLRGMFPNLKDTVETGLYGNPESRRLVLQYIERVDVRDGKVVGVQLKG